MSEKRVKKMPAGKGQFGIIVPEEIHTTAKHMAADQGLRISDIYTQGVAALHDAQQSGMNVSKMKLMRDITDGIPMKDWVLFEAMADFIRENPAADRMSMLKLILGKNLDANFELSKERKQA